MWSDCRSLVEEVRKVSCALWQERDSSLSPDSLFSIIWRLVPQFRSIYTSVLIIHHSRVILKFYSNYTPVDNNNIDFIDPTRRCRS
jgi:hypothetical protein